MALVWNQGRETVEAMLRDGTLERLPANRDHAVLLIKQAKQHLESANVRAEPDPEGAYAMLYDAVRKALTAVLENQGLRARGGTAHHASLYFAVVAQLDPPLGPALAPFQRMRQRRRQAEYPSYDGPGVSSLDVNEDSSPAQEIVAICERLLDEMPPFQLERE